MLRVWMPMLQAAEHALQSCPGMYCQVGHGLLLHEACVAGFDVVQAESGCGVAVFGLSVE
jgi:hypothetical protein